MVSVRHLACPLLMTKPVNAVCKEKIVSVWLGQSDKRSFQAFKLVSIRIRKTEHWRKHSRTRNI